MTAVAPVTPLFLSGRILTMAEQFIKAGRIASDNGGPAAPHEWLLCPSIVNFAFAAELALKGLHVVHSGKAPFGHDLEVLYLALPAEVQGRIRGSANPAMFNYRLHEMRNAFEVWRYAYEKDSIGVSTGHLHELAKTAIEVLIADQKSVFGT